ncbi:MAG TPA: helix-turn-helix domain-containing protein [Solirubrobacteraceae bacterium]|nr:helix-turn-helix domain-containing protein [Solirubrobacteraceae bacterium]
MSAAPLERPLRADALRNRERLTEAAAAAFRDEGLDVAVDEIARRAGVGVATLYRHFPAKADLVVAVTEAVLEDLGAAAAVALEGPDADVVARFLDAALRHQCRNRGFLQTLAQKDLPEAARRRLKRRVTDILAPVVAAGHRSGAIRADVGADELLVVVRMLGVVVATRGRRSNQPYLSILLRGLAEAR